MGSGYFNFSSELEVPLGPALTATERYFALTVVISHKDHPVNLHTISIAQSYFVSVGAHGGQLALRLLLSKDASAITQWGHFTFLFGVHSRTVYHHRKER